MPRPKRIAQEDRTTIKVDAAAAAKVRAIAFFENTRAVDLYSYILEAWVAGYEKALGRKVEDLQPGGLPKTTREGRALAKLREGAKPTED